MPFPWLYARVDLLRDESGALLLTELEAVEPSLFSATGRLPLTASPWAVPLPVAVRVAVPGRSSGLGGRPRL